MKLPSGSVTVPLEKLPSGHLAMVIDDYARLQAQQGGVTTTPMQLHANMPSDMTDGDIEPKQNLVETGASSSSRLTSINED